MTGSRKLKLNLFISLALLVGSVMFAGCILGGKDCTFCRGASSPGAPVKCEQCNNTGRVGGFSGIDFKKR